MLFTFKRVGVGSAALLFVFATVAPAAAWDRPDCPPRNPVVYDSGRWPVGDEYNPWNGEYRLHTYRERVHASTYDPNRGYVDPGSLRRVDRCRPDGRGGFYGEYGWTWSSGGARHQDTVRARLYYTSPWSSQHDSTRIVKGVP